MKASDEEVARFVHGTPDIRFLAACLPTLLPQYSYMTINRMTINRLLRGIRHLIYQEAACYVVK